MDEAPGNNLPFVSGTGIDLVPIPRIRSLLNRHGDRFVSRVFTGSEIEYCRNRSTSAVHFAGRFAAKEAVMKAIGTGWTSGVIWKDIAIHREEQEPPKAHLSGEAARIADNRSIGRIHVSISHTDDLAIAHAIGESSEA